MTTTLYGFIYEYVELEDSAKPGCASASDKIWPTKEEARAAMLASANAELKDHCEEDGIDYEPVRHCEDHIYLEYCDGYWTLFSTELAS